MSEIHLIDLLASNSARHEGAKARGLRWLAEHGYRIPRTWVLVDPEGDREEIVATLERSIEPDGRYAVRSSANVEDGERSSYAGQFTSELDVSGLDALVDAVLEVAASARVDGVESYRQHQGDSRPIEMSVIVQEMIDPVASGVSFSKNPVTGLSEFLVEAMAGAGDRLVRGATSPSRWVVRWGDFVEAPASAVISQTVVRSIVATTEKMAKEYGGPIDLEWVYDGQELWWLQVRPITALGDVTIYSRRIAKEVLPGIIKPLVWSINVPMVNQAWIALFEEAVGDLDLEPHDLARPFAYRAYFNMTAVGEIFAALGMPRESLELLLGLPEGSQQPRFKPSGTTLLKAPRMLALAARKTRYGAEIERVLPQLDAEYRHYAGKQLEILSDAALVDDIEALRQIGVRAASVNIVTPLLASLYTAILSRRLSKVGVDLATVDLTDGIDELTPLDPSSHLDRLAERIQDLDEAEREAIERDGYAAASQDVRDDVDEFLSRFGHFGDSGNDFSVPPWREMPDTVLRMAAARPVGARTDERLSWSDIYQDAPGRHRPVLRVLRRQAVTYIRHRDAVSSLYTFGYGVFRDYFLEIGRRLADRGAVAEPDDVMYLTFDEVRQALVGRGLDTPIADRVEARRTDIDAVAQLDMPDVIYGNDYVPVRSEDEAMSVWHGTPTARGHRRGVVRTVTGIADFAKVQTGDIIAIPYSDAGWTPLFAKAGGVVAESGGMLSHSSIVAREYGIPCIVSVSGATRIPDGSTVIVDGYRGVISLERSP